MIKMGNFINVLQRVLQHAASCSHIGTEHLVFFLVFI